jgi:hypothetical protein
MRIRNTDRKINLRLLPCNFPASRDSANIYQCLKNLYIQKVKLAGIRCLFDPWIRDTGCVKNQDPDPG